MVYSGFVVVTRDAFGEYEPCNPCQGKMGHNNSGDFVPCPDGVANGTFICTTYGGGDGPPPPEACDGGFDIWCVAELPRLLLRLVVAFYHRLLLVSRHFLLLSPKMIDTSTCDFSRFTCIALRACQGTRIVSMGLCTRHSLGSSRLKQKRHAALLAPLTTRHAQGTFASSVNFFSPVETCYAGHFRGFQKQWKCLITPP